MQKNRPPQSSPIFTDTINEQKLQIETVSDKVVNMLKKKGHEVSQEQAATGIFLLVQKGACLKSIDPNFKVILNPQDLTQKEVSLSVAQLLEAFKKCGLAGKLRQFARKYATDIANLSEAYNVPGILLLKYKKIHFTDEETLETEKSNFPEDKAHWMSDFQFNNPDCPREVQLLESAAKAIALSNSSKMSKKAGKKPSRPGKQKNTGK